MDYELAFKLKEAGFPFDFGGTTVYDSFPAIYGFDKYPTLEELIEACPKILPLSDNFGYDGRFTLHCSLPEKGIWHAGYELIDGWFEGGVYAGLYDDIGCSAKKDLLAKQKAVSSILEELWVDRNEIQIIGRPIRLADVLLALKENWVIAVGELGDFLKLEEGSGTGELALMKFSIYQKDGKGIRWNLQKDSLSDQSPECLEFLASLLK